VGNKGQELVETSGFVHALFLYPFSKGLEIHLKNMTKTSQQR